MTTPTEEPREPEGVQPIKPDTGEEQPDTGRYSAFRTDYGRYIGGVHPTKAKAERAARDAGVPSSAITVVEV